MTKDAILACTNIPLAKLPFRYLGVPISSKRLGVLDCAVLVEKVVHRIRALGARKRSYGGRLVLVQFVLRNLYNYWARIFILPKGILKKIDDICRNYLWQGSEHYEKVPPVAWAKVCQSKAQGGLGLVLNEVWNIAAIGKYVWWLASKKDHLWVKWVNSVYIKGCDWWTYAPCSGASSSWKKICWVRDRLKSGFESYGWASTGYSIRGGYLWLVPAQPKAPWVPLVWSRISMQKHCFTFWLAVQQRLLTRDRLIRRGMCIDGRCLLCAVADESHEHIFFACDYSKRCLELLSRWLQVPIPWQSVVQWWLTCRVKPLLRKQILGAAIGVLFYQIWQARNTSLHEMKLMVPSFIMKQVKFIICKRLSYVVSSQMQEKHASMIRGIMS
ncbi:uncharacterized protein LOC141649117 [Silene latifolia]|uniref:uncharacterized protein LOC141649117 n=1 Tax=Silene latifolia TaxID=37657 RepID=UPI003D773B92